MLVPRPVDLGPVFLPVFLPVHQSLPQLAGRLPEVSDAIGDFDPLAIVGPQHKIGRSLDWTVWQWHISPSQRSLGVPAHLMGLPDRLDRVVLLGLARQLGALLCARRND